MYTDEPQLVAAARRGEPQATALLVERFYGRLYAFLRRLCGSDAVAADLTQTTFSRVWDALPGFAGRSSHGSWLHGIAYHVYQDWWRRDGRLEWRPDEWWLEHADTGPTPDRLAARTDLTAVLCAAVDRLEPELRDTVHLHYYQGLPLRKRPPSWAWPPAPSNTACAGLCKRSRPNCSPGTSDRSSLQTVIRHESARN